MKYHLDTFDRIAPEKRARILTVATAEFANEGFKNANINAIAAKSGISVGSIYKYFESKENCFLTCIHYGAEEIENLVGEVVAREAPFFTKVESILRIIQKHSRENPDLIRLYNEITTESNTALLRKISFDLENITGRAYGRLIEDAREKGEIREDLDPALFAYFMDNLFMMLQFSYSCEYYQDRFRIYVGEDIFERDEDVIRQFINFLSAALSKK